MKFYRATYNSSHFSFEAYGETEYLAVSALHAALARHAKQYGCARGWYQPDDITAYPVVLGMGYRDHEAIDPSNTRKDTAAMTQILNYEFPDFDYALPVIEGFEDTSWHNDVCPSLTRHATNEKRTLILWCDYADPAKRDDTIGKRYTLVRGEYGDADDQETLCESEDLADILAAIQTA